MNNVKELDCTKCFHRKMRNRKIGTCDFVDEHDVEWGLLIVDEYRKEIADAIVELKEVR